MNVQRKIKVLHVVGSMTAGGIETLLMNIYRDIDREKFQFDFAVQTTVKKFYDDEIIELGGRIISHPKPQKNLSKYKRALKETLNKYGPYDVIHSHVLFFSGVILELARKQGVPIRIAHGHSISNKGNKSLKRLFYEKWMSKKIRYNSTIMLGCSPIVCKSLFGLMPNEHRSVEYIPNAIRLNEFQNIEKKVYENKNLTITQIGRLTEVKNHRFTLEVFKEVIKSYPNARLQLVGQGHLEENLKKKAIEIGLKDNIDFLGTRRDIPSILAQSDIFILPSFYEGLGIVLIEAQAAGVPSIISDTIPREADMELGLIKYKSLNDTAEDWAKDILKLDFDIPSERKRHEAIHNKKFSTERLLDRLIEIYKAN